METAALFRLLGDEARLRVLRLLSVEQLNVTELTSILGIAQSGVSRHLGLLRDAGLIEERRDAGFTFFRLAGALRSGANGFGPVWPLLESHFAAAAATRNGRADLARLEEVRRVRKENFDEHGAAGDRRQVVPGRSWAAWARALGHLLPPLEIADLGCGDGYLTMEAARFAKRVVAVDRSAAALARAKAMIARRRAALPAAVQFKRGDIERVPLADDSVDVALLSQALHHAVDPVQAVKEAARIVRPGGQVLILDLRAHEEQWVGERLGDRWLGFEDRELRRLLEAARLTDIKVSVGARRQRDPFTVLIASGAKADASNFNKDRLHVR